MHNNRDFLKSFIALLSTDTVLQKDFQLCRVSFQIGFLTSSVFTLAKLSPLIKYKYHLTFHNMFQEQVAFRMSLLNQKALIIFPI